MKKIFLISALIITFGLAFVVNAYAHYPRHYGKEDIKVETKKVDKGLQIIITSDDPEVIKDIQENERYYEETLADSDYCPHMEGRVSHHHSCMW